MRLTNKKFLTVFVVLLLLFSMSTWVSAAPEVPQKPDKFDYVYDFAHMLDQQDIAKLSSLGRELDDKTKAQVVVVTVDSLGDASIQDYANQLFRSWGLGNKDKNNGVLLLVNKENVLSGQPGKVRIEVGYGLEGAIPDGKAGRILDEYVLPRWEQQKYSEGILQGYFAIASEVAKEYNVTLKGDYAPVPAKTNNDSLPAPIMGLIIALILLSIFGRLFRGGRGGGGGGGFFGGGYGGGFGGGFGGGSGGWGGGGGFGGGFGGGSSGGGGADR